MNDSVPEGWKSVKLDDVAEERSDRIDYPSKSGHDRFVGLEHLDSGELTIRRWGSTAELLSAMKLFKSGDILIGRRNAYLKRASKADFDGVCSGDAYVVREKPGTIANELLPIILNSDYFWDYTIAHASGTMSKRAKWRDLAEYTFLLPSPEEQCRIATTIWAAEDCIVKGERFVTAAERAKQLLIRNLFSKGIGNTEFEQINGFGKFPKGWEIVQAQKLLDDEKIQKIQDGNYGGQYPRFSDFSTEGLPFISATHVSLTGEIQFSQAPKLPEKCYSRLRIGPSLAGDVILTHNATVGRVGIVPNNVKKCLASTTTTYYRVNSQFLHNRYLLNFMLTDFYQKQLISVMKQSTRNQVPITMQKKLFIILPPLAEQRQIAAILTSCDETIAAARSNIATMKALKMKMINEMLIPGI